MNKKLIKFLMLMAYCIPYGYLAMNGDATSGTMIFYGFMIAGFGILCGTAIRTNNTIILIIGNILSFISSYFFILRKLQSEVWSWYFKPFTPAGLLALITIVSFIIQIASILTVKSRKTNTNSDNR